MLTPSTIPLLLVQNRLATVQLLLYLTRLDKNSINARPSMVKKIYFLFCLKNFFPDLEKIQSTVDLHQKKQFLILFRCMGDEKKKQSHWTIKEKNIFSFMSTVLLCDPTEKKIGFSQYSTRRSRNLRTKFFIGTLPPPKKNCLQLQYYYGARVKETVFRYYVNVST